MRLSRALIFAMSLSACGFEGAPVSQTGVGDSTGSGNSMADGGGVSSKSSASILSFAVFGDSRPPNQNDTAGYPSTVISSIFSNAQASGAQFVVGTGDYMYATTQSAVDAQVALFMQAQASFTAGPVYHTMGNHECTGYTDSNCPLGTETPNVKAFMSKFVPAGVTTPYYRIDKDTTLGKVKFLFVAANAWSTAQDSWLKTQLADLTPYTFVVRHEPSDDPTAPGVTPSDALLNAAPFTLELLGHSHEYRKLDSQHVISGNGGAPLSGHGSFGFLMIDLRADGTVSVSEIDASTGMPKDNYRITAVGRAAP